MCGKHCRWETNLVQVRYDNGTVVVKDVNRTASLLLLCEQFEAFDFFHMCLRGYQRKG